MPLDRWTVRRDGREVHGLGDATILDQPSVGLICSVQCPGDVVLRTFDTVRSLRDAGSVVMGGFHSPMEKECLEILLRGRQPVIVVLAKGLGRLKLTDDWQTALDSNRLLILSPFNDVVSRISQANAQVRNEFVAHVATEVLIPYAAPGGKAATIARLVIERKKRLTVICDETRTRIAQELGSVNDEVFEPQNR